MHFVGTALTDMPRSLCSLQLHLKALEKLKLRCYILLVKHVILLHQQLEAFENLKLIQGYSGFYAYRYYSLKTTKYINLEKGYFIFTNKLQYLVDALHWNLRP